MGHRAMKVRKGDTVVVIAGNDKGKQGEIKEVLGAENRVVVAGINLRWKHRKPTQRTPKGERAQIECSIHASNVMLLDPNSGEPTRKRVDERKKKTKGEHGKAKKKQATKTA
jgi:large subunit ribosomal protein L24